MHYTAIKNSGLEITFKLDGLEGLLPDVIV